MDSNVLKQSIMHSIHEQEPLSLRLQAVGSLLASSECCNFLFSRRISRSCISIFWKFFQFCSLIAIFLTNFVHASRTSGQIFNTYCSFITILLTTFVHASRSSGRSFNFVHSSRLAIISDRDPIASFRVAQQWFPPEILGLCNARILQS